MEPEYYMYLWWLKYITQKLSLLNNLWFGQHWHLWMVCSQWQGILAQSSQILTGVSQPRVGTGLLVFEHTLQTPLPQDRQWWTLGGAWGSLKAMTPPESCEIDPFCSEMDKNSKKEAWISLDIILIRAHISLSHLLGVWNWLGIHSNVRCLRLGPSKQDGRSPLGLQSGTRAWLKSNVKYQKLFIFFF